jgi:adenylate cyclase
MQSSAEVHPNSPPPTQDLSKDPAPDAPHVQGQPPVDVPQTFERKFLVGDLPKVLGLNDGKQVSQGYLAVEPGGSEVRIRRSPDGGALCVRTGSGKNQVETEVALTKEQLDTLWPLTEGRRMSKVTYQIGVEETPVSLDIYEGQLNWLRIAEAEFKNRALAESFTPPPWFRREVTDLPAYRHSNLARE